MSDEAFKEKYLLSKEQADRLYEIYEKYEYLPDNFEFRSRFVSKCDTKFNQVIDQLRNNTKLQEWVLKILTLFSAKTF